MHIIHVPAMCCLHAFEHYANSCLWWSHCTAFIAVIMPPCISCTGYDPVPAVEWLLHERQRLTTLAACGKQPIDALVAGFKLHNGKQPGFVRDSVVAIDPTFLDYSHASTFLHSYKNTVWLHLGYGRRWP